jgi:hypothetical protein
VAAGLTLTGETAALWGVVATQVFSLASLIANGVIVSLREQRHRREDREDRQALAGHVKTTADVLAAKVDTAAAVGAATAQQLGHDIVTRLETAKVDLAANTQISTDALHETNGTKLLLVEEVRRRNDLQLATDAAHDRRLSDNPTVADLTRRVAALEDLAPKKKGS